MARFRVEVPVRPGIFVFKSYYPVTFKSIPFRGTPESNGLHLPGICRAKAMLMRKLSYLILDICSNDARETKRSWIIYFNCMMANKEDHSEVIKQEGKIYVIKRLSISCLSISVC